MKNYLSKIKNYLSKIQNFEIRNFVSYIIKKNPFGTIISLIALVFLFSLYFTIPTFYNYENFDKEFQKKLSKDFKLELKNISSVTYLMLPTPHFMIEECDIYFSNNPKDKILNVKYLKINIFSKNLHKKEKIELKNKALSGVLMELEKDVNIFNNALGILKRRVIMGEEFLNGGVSNHKLNELMMTYSFTGQNSNYNSLVSTGVIEFINDKALSTELVDYYERRYNMIQDMSEQLKKLYFEFLYFMKLNYPISSMDSIDDIENFQEWSTFLKVTQFNFSEKTLNKLNSDSIFRNQVYNIKRVILFYVKFYEDALIVNENLSSLIDNELK